ncbi:unnamed protein product [Lactuca virosa]|uniref:Proteasomal ATPase second OB domain-containing protein n=1 Tax=Lactuca virosa TaxID=75947 RepID=A0AAU9N194_9ASTR|nr:unnamed protein product [Lactuca virosa]
MRVSIAISSSFHDPHFYSLSISVIVKASSGPRYGVGCRSKVDKEKLTAGTRVVLDMSTLTIMRALPREVSENKNRKRAPQTSPSLN